MKIPYYRSLAGAVRANLQGGRGGACTTYYSVFDPEAIVIANLQNPRATDDKKNRDIHFAMMGNRLFGKKIAKNEDIFQFTSFSAPDLMEAFFSGDQDRFEQLYESYEASPLFPKTYINARTFLVHATQQSYEVGTHYFALIDEINRHTPFREPIHSSNLCVAPDTPILTKEYGYRPISLLHGQAVHVWNGDAWSKTTIIKTGINQPVVEVRTTDGTLRVTLYHKWPVAVVDAYGVQIAEIEKRTHELFAGNKLVRYDLAIADHGTSILSDAYPEDFIPDTTYTLGSRINWLGKLMDRSGICAADGSNLEIQFLSQDEGMLNTLRLVLQELGVRSFVVEAEYADSLDATPWYLLSIPNNSLVKLKALGLVLTHIDLSGLSEDLLADDPHPEILSVTDYNQYVDTYCFNEPIHHRGMFAGVLSCNCLEVTQPTAPYYQMTDLYSAFDTGVMEVVDTENTVHSFKYSQKVVTDRGETFAGDLKVDDVLHFNLRLDVSSKKVSHIKKILQRKISPEVSLCSLAGIVEPNIHSDAEYQSAAYYALKMIDKCIHRSDYILPHVGYTAKNRLNAGVGLVGVAYSMAKMNLKYDSIDGLYALHRIAERHSYFMIRASLQLGIEKGNAPWMHKTKWPAGWLPIDTYKRTVDKIVTHNLRYDWETLRQEIIANKGIRNSSIVSHMPTESSSKAAGVPNSIYPVRELSMKKTDLSNALDWCAPDNDILADAYQSAWDIRTRDLIKVYAVFQKFADQAISADFYKDRSKDINLSSQEMIEEYLDMIRYGMKTRYYQNTRTSSIGKDHESIGQKGCGAGGCTL